MTFTAAVRSCLARYAGFSGRAGRAEYWWFALFSFVAGTIAYVVDAGSPRLPVACATVLALCLPILAVGSRRLHDIGLSGWWNLLNLLPGGGQIALTVLLLQPGDAAANRFGEPYVSAQDAHLAAELAAIHGTHTASTRG